MGDNNVNEANNKKKAKKIFSKSKNISFNHKDYICMVEVEETTTRPVVERGKIVERKIPTGRMIEIEKFSPEFIKANINLDIAKCRYRAAKAFDVSVDQLKEGYKILNGKKLDGFYVTSLIDRYGFSKGPKSAINRDKLAEQYENKTPYSVDIAQNKLKEILQSKDILKSFMEHIKDIKDEFESELKDKTVYGE